jgi:hypothetical protein
VLEEERSRNVRHSKLTLMRSANGRYLSQAQETWVSPISDISSVQERVHIRKGEREDLLWKIHQVNRGPRHGRLGVVRCRLPMSQIAIAIDHRRSTPH